MLNGENVELCWELLAKYGIEAQATWVINRHWEAELQGEYLYSEQRSGQKKGYTLVTVTELLIEAYLPSLYEALGIYIPLIVVNCIILGRAEAYANKHTPLLAVMDGLGMGIGFTLALTLAALFREILGNGTAFGAQILPKSFDPIGIFIQPPGAFLIIAFIMAVMNAIGIKTRQRKLVDGGCDGVCANCAAACDKSGEVSAK